MTTRTRISVSHTLIVSKLRDRIVRGQYEPGARLPTRVAIESEFAASTETVQRAFRELHRQGFVDSRGREGTYVVDRPPHLCDFGLVFPYAAQSERRYWSRLLLSLERVSAGIDPTGRRRLLPQYAAHGEKDSPDLQQLMANLHEHRLAGLILACPVADIGGEKLVRSLGLPVIGTFGQMGSLPRVVMDTAGLSQRVMRHFVNKGRRRVGVLHTVLDEDCKVDDRIADAIAASGLQTRPHWLQPIGRPFATAQSVVEMMMHLPPSERPDALYLADDHLVEPAARGLVSAGVKVGKDIEVVAHANFPDVVTTALPMRYAGFDTRELLRLCMAALERARQDRTEVQSVVLPPAEDDLHVD